MASLGRIDNKRLNADILKFEKLFIELKKSLDTLTCRAHSLADELDKTHRNVAIASVTGSAASVVGGVLVIGGAVLSFFTFGAASPLMVVGGVIAGAGGTTVGGAQLTKLVLSTITRNKFQADLEKHSIIQLEILKICRDVSRDLERLGKMDDTFPQWVQFWGRFLGDPDYKGIPRWDDVKDWIEGSVELGVGVAEVGTTLLRGVAAGLGATAHGMFSLVLVPIDIYTLVENSIIIDKKSPDKVATQLRNFVAKMAKAYPTTIQVRAMSIGVPATLNQMAMM